MIFGQRPTPILNTLSDAQVQALKATGIERSYRKNANVFDIGTPTDGLFFVLRGRFRLRDRDRDGREVTVNFAAQGEAFGLEALAGFSRRILSATAAENSEVLLVEAGRLRDLLERDSALARHLVVELSTHLLHGEERVKMLAFLDVPSRLAGLLLWLADRYGKRVDDGIEVPYWFTHQEVADLIGSTRETVTTVLADFKRSGQVTSRNHHFVIHDRDAVCARMKLPKFGTGAEGGI